MNILDYITWRGDLSFKASPFNDVDNLVISQMAYTLVDKYFKDKDRYTISELSELFFKDHTDKEVKASKSFVGQAPFVLKAMAKADRYKDLVVHDFVSTINEETFEQFCAFMVDLDSKTRYIAFRGTDDTLLGWHEDLCLSYEIIPAQISAREYMKKHVRRLHKYYIGGHSKGGNLAMYASLYIPLNNLIRVYSNDGPGLNKKVLSKEEIKAYDTVIEKSTKIIPEFDVFGSLFSHNKNTYVIKSDGVMLMQHDAFTWLVEGTKFVPGKLTEESKTIRKAFSDFLKKATPDECKDFSTELFKALDEANVKNVSEFMTGGIPVLAKTFSKLTTLSDNTKKFGTSLVAALVKGYGSGVSEKAKNIKESLLDRASKKEKEILNFINDEVSNIKK